MERQDSLTLFYQLAFEHEVQPQTMIISGNYSQPFNEVFQLICERTGAHVPEGDIFSDGIYVPNPIQNHEVFNLVLQFFRRSTPNIVVAA